MASIQRPVYFIMFYLQKIADEIFLKFKLSFKRENSHNSLVKSTGDLSQVVSQPGSVIGNQTIVNGLTVTETKVLVETILDLRFQGFQEFQEEGQRLFVERAKAFENNIIQQLSILKPEELSKFRDPDTQYILKQACLISGRKKSDEFRSILSDLVIKRIRSNGEDSDLMDIVYNESILTIGKLTDDQLKILAICYQLQYTRKTNLSSWEDLNSYFNTQIKPFADFKNTKSEFDHIVYSGCGTIASLRQSSIDNNLKVNYSLLFIKDLVFKSEIESFKIDKEDMNELFSQSKDSDLLYHQKFNIGDLNQYLKDKGVAKEIINKIQEVCIQHLDNDDALRSKVIGRTDFGKEIFKLWDDSKIKSLSLTSVGIAIAASYLEKKVGVELDMKIWIN